MIYQYNEISTTIIEKKGSKLGIYQEITLYALLYICFE